MARPQERSGELVVEYCKANPKASNRKLATMLQADHPDVFKSAEQARRLVRYYMAKPEFKLAKADDGREPRIACIDIETFAGKCYYWRHWKQNIPSNMVINPPSLLSWVAKFVGEDYIYYDSVQHDKDSARCAVTLWDIFDDADIIVAHNGKAFDTKMMNTEWILHELTEPSPYRQVDTLKAVREICNLGLNKLDFIGKFFSIGRKKEHEGFDLWRKCEAGDKGAWKRMMEYNEQDVLLLEEVYLKLRAWDKRHPNVALLYGDSLPRCIVCGGKNLTEITKDTYTGLSKFNTYRCDNCGKVQRDGKRKNVKSVYRHSL